MQIGRGSCEPLSLHEAYKGNEPLGTAYREQLPEGELIKNQTEKRMWLLAVVHTI
jgi:hypothetical protein